MALVTYFIIYYGLPYLVNNYGFNFGYFTKYLLGPVRNPAIASASAIVLSTIAGIIMHLITKKK